MNEESHPSTRLPGAARAGHFAERGEEQAKTVDSPPSSSVPSPVVGSEESDPSPASVNFDHANGSQPRVGWERFQPNGGGLPTLTPPARMPATGWTPPPSKEKPAEWGRKRHWVRIATFGMMRAKASPDELENRHNEQAVRNVGWSRCVRISVANPKGGVGKTPTALILGGVIAQLRGGGVLVWDANQNGGTLRARSEGVGGMCVSDVAADPDRFSTPGGMAAAVATQSSFADVLGVRRVQWHLDETLVERVQTAVDRTYRISIADTGGNESRLDSSFWRLLRHSDQLVVPVTATKDALDKAQALLADWADQPSELSQRAIVAVLDNGGPKTPGLAKELTQILQSQGVRHVVHLPYDPAIAAGTAITLGDLSQRSRIAWTRLAAATLSSIVTQPDRRY